MLVQLIMENKNRLSFIRFALASMAMLLSLAAYAQGSYSIKLRLLDSKSAEPVSFATVSIAEKGQDKALKYVLSDSEGNAEILKVKKGTYVLKAELMGYNTHSQEVTVTKDVNLGDV